MKRMKQLSTLAAAMLVTISGMTQINFDQGGSLDAAVQRAKKEGKHIFVDVYAVWCGPCKKMEMGAFQQPDLSAFYNEHFVSVKIDGEKGEGPEIMSKYGLRAYPTLLYMSPDGDLVEKVTGAPDETALIKLAKNVLDSVPSSVYGARKVYYSSAKAQEDLKKYLKVMVAKNSDSLAHFSRKYYERFPELNISDPVEFEVFYQVEEDATKSTSVEFLSHPELYNVDKYTVKLGMFVQQSVKRAAEKRDFTIVQTTVHLIYPYMVKAMQDQSLPTEEEYIMYLRAKFEGG